MTSPHDGPLNLQAMLSDYRCGKRELPTYDELVQIDIAIGSRDAVIAALRDLIKTFVHEKDAMARTYFMHGAAHDG
jgi:hypothetical protein